MSQPSATETGLRIQLRSETQQKLQDRAANAGMSLEMYIEGLAEREAQVDGSQDAIAKAVARIQSRTPEQLLADQERILGRTPAPRPLPEGKTLFDVVEGTWPGDETEEQVHQSLEKMS